MKKFASLSISSKFAICGLPIRFDAYRTCYFGCRYCFSENRIVGKHDAELCVADIPALERRLARVYDDKDIEPTNFMDALLTSRVTWH